MSATTFSLRFFDNMCIHSHDYLNQFTNQYYQIMAKHDYPECDVKILKKISQPYFGMIYFNYYKSKRATKQKYGTRGVLRLIMDSNRGNDFYQKCIEKGYLVIQYQINHHIEKKTNIIEPFIPFQWKQDEEHQKVVSGRIWNDNDEDLGFLPELFQNYYSLEHRELYTPSHLYYSMTIIDYEETSSDFLQRFYSFLVQTYGRPSIQNMDNAHVSPYYKAHYMNLLHEESDIDEEEHICPNCQNENRETDDEEEVKPNVYHEECDTDVE